MFGERSYIRENDSEKLEDRLGDILVTLYEKAEENRIVREAREEAERKRVEEARRREENRQRKEQEIRLVKELVNKAEDYRIAKEIREYIQAMIDSGNEDITPEWIEWALKKADWYDPSIATEDEYLGKRQHEKSAEEKEKSLQDSIRKSWYHLAIFVSRLWQIHVFGEGNTRTTAVFFIKYLRTLGFDATNDIFAENAWYFRNAL
ncbi:MAG: Fic family protein, partial [Lachnospiraceae bacterium]|nr:Fic family protein [Lachnospiraceae bacterium]